MSSKKVFNGFEAWFIETALLEAIKNAEKQVLEEEKNSNQRSIYAPGYFTMVGNELIDKVKKHTKTENNGNN
jgi:hypothetical protein